MVVKLCFTSHGQPATGSRRRAMTARRSSSVCSLGPSSAILTIVQGWGNGAGNLVKFTWNVTPLAACPHFPSDVIDSHKIYYGKFGSALLVMLPHEPVEQPHAEARSPAPIDLAIGRRKSSASDIEMRPCHSVLDEALEELRGGNRAAPFATSVLYVGDLGVDHLVVFRSERQTPQPLACDLAGLEQTAGKLLVVAEQPGMLFAKRD